MITVALILTCNPLFNVITTCMPFSDTFPCIEMTLKIVCMLFQRFGWPHLHQINKIMHGLLFLVLSYLYGLCSAANRYTMVPERTELRNILISDNIFHKTESTSALNCFRQCNDNKSYLSISYHGGTHTCFCIRTLI